jgi:TIGR03009 family protein
MIRTRFRGFSPRKFFPVVIACCVSAGIAPPVFGQDRPPVAQPKPPQQQDRAGLANPLLQVEKVSPELQQVLEDWEKSSRTIESLQGEHRRFVYDKVFQVEKHAKGQFYYEAPDKGRIDISKIDVPPGAVGQMKGPAGAPFKLQSDRPERWICTGQEIMQVNDEEKTVEVFSIPPDARGENIMEGPLPFLFGMPAEKAKRRYVLTLLKQDENQIWLGVKPRWQQDAANWKEAKVILNRDTYLPSAVMLVDPTGNLETVYSFRKLEANYKGKRPGILQRIWPVKDPFKPDLDGYKLVKAAPPPSQVGWRRPVTPSSSSAAAPLPKKKRSTRSTSNNRCPRNRPPAASRSC